MTVILFVHVVRVIMSSLIAFRSVVGHWGTPTRSELKVFSSFSLFLSLAIEGPRRDVVTIVRLVRVIGPLSVPLTVFIICVSTIRACGRIDIAHISLSIIVLVMVSTAAVSIVPFFVDKWVLVTINMMLLFLLF